MTESIFLTPEQAKIWNEYETFKCRGLSSTTLTGRKQAVSNLVEAIGDRNFSDVTPGDLITCTDEMLQKYQGGTYNKYLSDIKAFLIWFYQRKLGKDALPLQMNDVLKYAKTSIPIRPEDLLTESEVFSLISHAENFKEQAIISLIYETLSRRNEITILKVKDFVYDKRGYAFIRKKIKKGQGRGFLIRDVPIHYSVPYLQNWISQHPDKENPDSPLFVGSNDNIPYRPLTGQTIYSYILKAAINAKIEKKVWPHLLIHTGITWMLEHGYTDQEIMYIRGWSNTAMLKVYFHLRKELADIIARKRIPDLPIKEEVKKEDKECPRCRTVNHWSTDICQKCFWKLDKPFKPIEIEYSSKIKELEDKNKVQEQTINKLLDDFEFLKKHLKIVT